MWISAALSNQSTIFIRTQRHWEVSFILASLQRPIPQPPNGRVQIDLAGRRLKWTFKSLLFGLGNKELRLWWGKHNIGICHFSGAEDIFVFTLIHMTSRPHGTNLIKVNLFFLVVDRNRSIFICLQSPLICFSSTRTQMGSPECHRARFWNQSGFIYTHCPWLQHTR